MERMCIIVTAGMYKRNDKNVLLDRMHKKQIKGNAHRDWTNISKMEQIHGKTSTIKEENLQYTKHEKTWNINI